jgi:hypothetical protein
MNNSQPARRRYGIIFPSGRDFDFQNRLRRRNNSRNAVLNIILFEGDTASDTLNFPTNTWIDDN